MTTAFSAPEIQPVILAFPSPITEDVLRALGHDNPAYRFETTAEGDLVVTPLTRHLRLGRRRGAYVPACRMEQALQARPRHAVDRWHHPRRQRHQEPRRRFHLARQIASLSPSRKKRAFEKIAPDAVFELL